MRVPLRLAEIVAAPSFSEGNARYLQRKVLIVSMETAGPDRMIEAMVLVEDPARKVRFVACADGTLGTHDCSVHGTELCPDIIAAILKYNEIAIADLSPVTQLAELADVSALAPTEERPIPLRIDKEGRITFGTVPGREAGTLGHLLDLRRTRLPGDRLRHPYDARDEGEVPGGAREVFRPGGLKAP